MAWNDLTLSDKARMIQLAVKSGITDLRTIQEVYNKYEEGGYKKPKGASPIKDIAYRIAANEDVFRKGHATIKDVVKAITDKEPIMDDNKYAYIYGTGERYPEVKEPIQGFDYSDYLERSGYKDIKNVYGVINPNGEYHLDEEYRPIVEELAKHNYHLYDNADDMFLDSDPDILGYRDDVANFIHQFGVDKDGNVVINDSDVYDFNPSDYNYVNQKKSNRPIVRLQARLMDKIGTPYIIRQEGQPVKFDGAVRGSWNIQNHLDNMTDADIAKATESGLLEAAKITANKQGDGGIFRTYENGGDKQPWWVRASLGAMMADAPAVATASGWTYDNNGNIVQTEQDSEGAKKLRENLTQIAMMPMMDFAGETIGSAIAGTKAYKTYRLAKELKDIIKNTDLTEPIVDASKIASASKAGTGSLFYEPNFQYTFDDLSHIPEPTGVGYSGYTPTIQSEAGRRFVEDVDEATNWALQRGRVRPTQNQIFDFTDVDWIGGGAESRVYNDPNNPDRVLKVRWAQKGSDTPEEAIEEGLKVLKKENFPIYEMPLSIDGATKLQYGDNYLWYPVYSQERLRMLPDVPSSPEAAEALKQMTDRFANRIGTIPYHKWDADYAPINNIFFEDYYRPGAGAKDFKPENIGFAKDGTLMGIDLHKYGGDLKGLKYPGWQPPVEAETIDKNPYTRIPTNRYNSAFNALVKRGYNKFDADRLAQILSTQSISETGWVDRNDSHNYAGYLDTKRKLIKYPSPEAFWDTHVNNLSNRWPEWDTANSLREYFDIINNSNLGLDTKEKFDAYNKTHRDNPAYIYAPDWENTDYLKKMLSIDKRAKKSYNQKKGPLF